MIQLASYHRCTIVVWAIVCALFSSSAVDAFIPSHQKPPCHSSHNMAGFLDDVGKFFGGLGDNNDDPSQGGNGGELVEEDGDYAGSTRIITVPAKTIKLGGFRLYCNLYLMGLQNTPEKGCWKASQSDNSEVNLRYRDLSGSIIIQFSDYGVTVDRLGSSPSMKYLMHESMILNGFLDEIKTIVNDGDVADENRLLTLVDSDAIENARGAVSFG